MTDERRYQDEEIRAIFAAAAEGPGATERAVAPEGGLTLPDLREIGREVGIPPERIEAAALALDREPPVVAKRSWLGMPLTVGRTVDLPRALTDREWGILLGELRQTFRARGHAESHGELREWTNGNLHAYVEPTETGYRLRLGTMKGTALPVIAAGAASIGYGLVSSIGDPLATILAGPGMLLGLGAAAVGVIAVRQSGWARRRAEQMDYIVSRVQALLAAGPPDQG